MKTKSLSVLLLTALLGGTPAIAQFTPPTAGAREITIGGNGTADHGLDNSSGGLAFSYGSYLSDRWLVSVRQSANYTHSEATDDTDWNGSTRIAADYLFGTTAWRPLVGANLGYIYGDNVNDTWAAGIEAGLRYYVNQTTFIYGLLEYAWLFDDPVD